MKYFHCKHFLEIIGVLQTLSVFLGKNQKGENVQNSTSLDYCVNQKKVSKLKYGDFFVKLCALT